MRERVFGMKMQYFILCVMSLLEEEMVMQPEREREECQKQNAKTTNARGACFKNVALVCLMPWERMVGEGREGEGERKCLSAKMFAQNKHAHGERESQWCTPNKMCVVKTKQTEQNVRVMPAKAQKCTPYSTHVTPPRRSGAACNREIKSSMSSVRGR